MTENDTKEETGEVENYDNYYNESDNYYIDKALGNIKRMIQVQLVVDQEEFLFIKFN